MILDIDKDICLRSVEVSDALDVFGAIDSQRDYLGRWLPFVKGTKCVLDTESFIESVLNVNEEKLEFVFVIRYCGEFAGLIGFRDTDCGNNKTEIGYWLKEEFQRKGIITRAVYGLCNFAFEKMGMNRIQIRCGVGNIASKNIPKRLGFVLEGIEREGELLSSGIYTDLEVYSKLKSEFN
ncbi:MAG: GNAT family N-acetyltransferase [Bacteroidales bacterium]|nr:GNAT family N-acetyltransferase [Bacteroidales bacterium]